jgi:hypothetical protein
VNPPSFALRAEDGRIDLNLTQPLRDQAIPLTGAIEATAIARVAHALLKSRTVAARGATSG